MNTLLLVCLLGQAPPIVQDMEFKRIQIEWIASTKTVGNLEHVLPWRQALLIRSLGCEHGDCRALARDELSRLGHEAFDALVWGTRMKDREIAYVSTALLNCLYLCSDCNGLGEVDVPPAKEVGWILGDQEFEDDEGGWGGGGIRTCQQCDGTGDARYNVKYTENEPWLGWGGYYKIVPAKLFPPIEKSAK